MGYEDKQFYPIFVFKGSKEKVLNLLLITEDEKKHYVLIKDFNRMMYNKTKHQHRKHFCMLCLQCFSTEEILSKHKTNCKVTNGEQAITMLQKGSKVQFQNFNNQMPVPLIAITENLSGCQ